jgi:Zn-dependent alcohol dehydrogenase
MLIRSSQAAVLFESFKPLEIVEIDFPKNLEPGQVLVELITSGICGAQINEIDAVKGDDLFLPHLMGHEGLAKVLEVGPGVHKIHSGDTVIMHWRPSKGIVAEPPKYKYEGKIVNAGWVTTFNKHAIVSENRLTKINGEEINPIIAPLLGCALTTALGVLENDAQLTHRDSLLIMGFGGVGISIAKFAQFMNVRNIVVVDSDPNKRNLAKKLGIHNFIHFENKEKLSQKLKIVFGDQKPSVAIDTSGKPEAIEICYEESSEAGRIILVGVPRIGDKTLIYTLPLHFGKSIKGSKGGGSVPDLDIPIILDLLQSRKISMDDYPVTSLSFSEINIGIEKLRKGHLGRIVIDFSLN